MGVPSFYRWIAERYPKIVTDAIEHTIMVDGKRHNTNIKDPNPNGREFDNLYLDMNGIIHPCTHPEDKPAPKNMDEMLLAIFDYIDRIVELVRPRKVLYMAIDGVAPRAKMNQQRSRRFRAAKEAKDKEDSEKRIIQELIDDGKDVTKWNTNKEEKRFDSNVITPGTEFMDQVARGLQFYISQRITSNPGWCDLQVILSDANSPGEGEHKIMNFIRRQRIQPDYNPQTSHVLYGLDADLIMLAIATHEPHFFILREVVFFGNKSNTCNICNQPGHYAAQCQGVQLTKVDNNSKDDQKPTSLKPYQFVTISILREYLINDLKCKTPFPFDNERILDDWVFLCFFVGNDFLPHLPTLKIREGALELLMDLYKKSLPGLSDYLTHNGEVNLKDVETIMQQVGELEDSILRSRRLREQRAKENRKNRKKRNREEYEKSAYSTPVTEDYDVSSRNRMAAKKLKTQLYSDVSNAPDAINSNTNLSTNGNNKTINDSEKKKEESDDEDKILDIVKLGEDGWKQRYYLQKFHVLDTDKEFKRELCRDYVEGLCWVMKYYYQGCASWTWFYPHHYAPFSSDLVSLDSFKFEFNLGKPFRPFEQLMGVLPSLSGHALPKKCQELMTNPDSPIIDFYPDDFELDMDGCRFAWQAVALLPFIDEKRLLEAMKDIECELTEEEKLRNSIGNDLLFIGYTHPIIAELSEHDSEFSKTKTKTVDNEIIEKEYKLQLPYTDNLFGIIKPSGQGAGIDSFLVSTINGMNDLEGNRAFCFIFIDPRVPKDYIWDSKLLKNVVLPRLQLSTSDFERDKSYRFGRFTYNSIRNNTTKFHDQRHQPGAKRDTYNSRDYHGGGNRNYNNKNYNNNNRRNYNNNRDYNGRGNRNYNNNNRNNNNRNYNNQNRYNTDNQSTNDNRSQITNEYNPYSRPSNNSANLQSQSHYNPFGNSMNTYQNPQYSPYQMQYTNNQTYTPYPQHNNTNVAQPSTTYNPFGSGSTIPRTQQYHHAPKKTNSDTYNWKS